jgi:hypothetical protein
VFARITANAPINVTYEIHQVSTIFQVKNVNDAKRKTSLPLFFFSGLEISFSKYNNGRKAINKYNPLDQSNQAKLNNKPLRTHKKISLAEFMKALSLLANVSFYIFDNLQ